MTANYVDVDGLNTYYEVHGDGAPLLLLHGGFCTVEVLSELTNELARHYRVYVPERRGHGRTADIDGPFTYERMADDTTGFMEAIGLESAHLVGFSDGANTALIVAIQRPDLVQKMVSIGGNFHYHGLAQQFQHFIESSTPETFLPDLVAAYKQHSPDGPEHFSIVFAKIMAMWRTEPELTSQHLTSIAAASLIVSADRDLITLEHTIEMFRAIPRSQLYVVPGSTHMSLIAEHARVVGGAVAEFLAA